MKQRYFLLLIICLMASGVKAATWSGTVSNANTSSCGPMSGQKVYIGDSLHSYFDSAVTNSLGQYSFTIPSSVSSGMMAVYSTGCNALERYMYMYTGASQTGINFILCGDQKHVVGAVRLSGLTTTDSFNRGSTKTWVIQQTVNPVTLDTMLAATDSMVHGDTVSSTSPGSPAAFGFWYVCMPTGTILIKSALEPSNPYYSSYLPTYWTAPGAAPSLTWNTATPVPAANFNASGPVIYSNMHMIAGTNPGGPGFIGGSVLLGANKSAAVGDPLAHYILILTKSTGEAVAYTYSDASGKFQFPSVPYGSYKLFGDVLGKQNPALSLTLSPGNDHITNVLFEENHKDFKGSFNTGVGSPGALTGINVYPNPATDYLAIDGLNTIKGNKTLVLSTITGTVARQTVTKDNARFSAASLAPGVYVLHIETEAGSTSFRIIK